MMRLRQIALVARDLEPTVQDLTAVLGLEVCYRDPAVAKWGLINALMPIDGNFLEVVTPVEENTSAGRYLERRHGDGGYMVILQCDDALAERARVAALGIRAVASADRPHYRYTHFHPADTQGILLSIDSTTPGNDWHAEHAEWAPAGTAWKPAVRTAVTKALVGAEIQHEDPAALAALWSKILNLPAGRLADGNPGIRLENAVLRFVPASDGRGRGLGAIDVTTADRGRLLAEAQSRGLQRSATQVELCGCRVNLV